MSILTSLGLKKPAKNEFFTINDQNGNMDKLDELINERIKKAMIAHNLATENSEMVLGADMGPVIVQKFDTLNEGLLQLENNLGGCKLKHFYIEQSITTMSIQIVNKTYNYIDIDLSNKTINYLTSVICQNGFSPAASQVIVIATSILSPENRIVRLFFEQPLTNVICQLNFLCNVE